jgi:hypothetical protein
MPYARDGRFAMHVRKNLDAFEWGDIAPVRFACAAWELAKFLCAPDQLIDDAQRSGFVEVSRRSVLSDPRFAARFRPDLVESTRATRALRAANARLRGTRSPWATFWAKNTRALAGETAQEALIAKIAARPGVHRWYSHREFAWINIQPVDLRACTRHGIWMKRLITGHKGALQWTIVPGLGQDPPT